EIGHQKIGRRPDRLKLESDGRTRREQHRKDDPPASGHTDTPGVQSVRSPLSTLENSDNSSSEISCSERRSCMIARSTRWPAKEPPPAIRMWGLLARTGITVRK